MFVSKEGTTLQLQSILADCGPQPQRFANIRQTEPRLAVDFYGPDFAELLIVENLEAVHAVALLKSTQA